MADEKEKVDQVEEKAKPDSKPVEQAKPEAKAAPEAEAKAKPEANATPEAEAKAKAAPETAAKPEAKSEDKAEAKPAGDAVSAGTVDGEEPVKKIRAKGARVSPSGIAHIRSTFNNTLVCITDMRGGVVAWSSAGKAGFKGSRKNTAFAATMVGQDAARTASSKGMHEVEVRVQGAGAGRESAIRAIQASGMTVSMIKDITPIPHNGCRPKKRRRV